MVETSKFRYVTFLWWQDLVNVLTSKGHTNCILKLKQNKTVHHRKRQTNIEHLLSVGQTVRHVNDPARCRDISPGDIIIAINGVNVREYPHDAVVDELRRCERGATATLTLLAAASPQRLADVANDNGQALSRNEVTDSGVSLESGRSDAGHTYVRRTPLMNDVNRRTDNNGSTTGARQSAGVVNNYHRRGENGIRVYKSASRFVPAAEADSQGHHNRNVNGDRIDGHDSSKTGGNGSTQTRNVRVSSALSKAEEGFVDRNGNNIAEWRSHGEFIMQRPHTRLGVPTYGGGETDLLRDVNQPTTSAALNKRPASTTPLSTVTASDMSIAERQLQQLELEEEERYRRKLSELSLAANGSQSSRSNRLVAFIRRPITPVLQRRSKTQRAAAAAEQNSRPPSTSSMLTRSPSPCSPQNFSGTPDFIPASVYGVGPLDNFVRYRSTADGSRNSVSSSTSMSIATNSRPPSATSGLLTDSSAASTGGNGVIDRTSPSSSMFSATVAGIESLAAAANLDETRYSLSTTASFRSASAAVRQPLTADFGSSSTTTTSGIDGGSESMRDLDNNGTRSLHPKGPAAAVESLAGREMCNGYNVRTETIYSSPVHGQFGQRRNNKTSIRPASTDPTGKEPNQFRPPPVLQVFSGAERRPGGVVVSMEERSTRMADRTESVAAGSSALHSGSVDRRRTKSRNGSVDSVQLAEVAATDLDPTPALNERQKSRPVSIFIDCRQRS